MKVDNVERTAHRVAWELGRGALSSHERVLTCETNPACVRVDHLRLERATETPGRRPPRARKGTALCGLCEPEEAANSDNESPP